MTAREADDAVSEDADRVHAALPDRGRVSRGDLRAPLADAFSCPRCGHQRAWQLSRRDLYECARCHYQSSLTAGTVFACTRTDLRKWFLAIWLLASTKKAPSAAELTRQLGVTGKTAWLMRRKIVHAMARRPGESLLRGIVELDEGFIGGKHRGPAARGRRQPGKALVAISAEQTPGGGLGGAHLCVIAGAGAVSLSAAAREAIATGSAVRTDGWNGYLGLEKAGYDHHPRSLPTGADVDEWLPGRISCSPASSAGAWTSSTASAPLTCRRTSMSSATGSTVVESVRISFAGFSTAACSTPAPRHTACSEPPE